MQGLAWLIRRELPFDRGQESEADHIGLILMAKAGYDPREAIPFWEQMSSANQSKGAPEFVNPPVWRTRIKQLRQWMPEAPAVLWWSEILRGKRMSYWWRVFRGIVYGGLSLGLLTGEAGAQTTQPARLIIDHKVFAQPQRQGQPLPIQATISSPAGIHKAEVFCRQAGGRDFPP